MTGDSRDRFNRGTRNSTLIILDRHRSCGVDTVQWKIQVPNGYYRVTLTYSDPEYGTNSRGCTIQGQNATIQGQGTKEMFVNVEGKELTAGGLFTECASFSSIQIVPESDGIIAGISS